MSEQAPAARAFSDAELLSIAVACLKHARQSTALRDCQCAACKGFMQESGELLELIDKGR